MLLTKLVGCVLKQETKIKKLILAYNYSWKFELQKGLLKDTMLMQLFKLVSWTHLILTLKFDMREYSAHTGLPAEK